MKNSLDLAIIYDLHSISLPTIGLGRQAYPLDTTASLLISSINEFISKNKNFNLTVNLIVYKNDRSKFAQAFQTEMLKIAPIRNGPTAAKRDEIATNVANDSLSK